MGANMKEPNQFNSMYLHIDSNTGNSNKMDRQGTRVNKEHEAACAAPTVGINNESEYVQTDSVSPVPLSCCGGCLLVEVR